MHTLRQEYTVKDCCAALGLARSSYYRRAKAKDRSEQREAVARIAGRFPTYGSRRIKAELARAPHGMRLGRQQVSRLMRELGLMVKRKPRQRRTTDSGHGNRRYRNLVKGMAITRPNQVWVADITYIRLRSHDVYLSILMDACTRMVRGWNLGGSLGQELALLPLKAALSRHPAPCIHHSDQGRQYAAKAYVQLLQAAGTQISMAAVGSPNENGYAERLIRTIKEEEVYLSEYRSMAEARQQIGHFIEVVYARERVHSALGYLTPAEFEMGWC